MKSITTLLLSSLASASFACSIALNEQAINNKKVAEAANEFSIDLTKVTKIKAEDFSFLVLEEDPATYCPTIIQTDTKITLEYKPNLTTKCELSVTVRDVSEGDLAPTYEFMLPASSCSYVPIRIVRPIRIYPRS
ncbi:MAG: hypothetical protein CME65_10965 [Halobacteriovoraceae bacterium]|nr:hypothetical protein [Halobacteriovoraceae bacterium]|tara:strand:- start:841 stop:1245 length:405 start_codon:yes stop_codon:yes gene_type:complete